MGDDEVRRRDVEDADLETCCDRRGTSDVTVNGKVAGNTASIKLLERCGFRREGTVHHDGDEYVLLVRDNDLHGGSPRNPKIERSSEPAGSNG